MNILIIGGSGNAPSANSVCVRNMARVFVSRGHKVWNLASGEECIKKPGNIGGAELWQIPRTWYAKFAKSTKQNPTFLKVLFFKIISALRHLILLFIYPTAEPIRSIKVFKKARRLVQDNNIHLVLSIYNNYTNIYCGMMLKRMYRDKIKSVSYHLDLRTENINASAAVRNYVHKHAMKSIVEESNVVDRILIPYSGQSDAERVKDIALNKIVFVGFPVFINEGNEETCKLPFDSGFINISYIGTLSKENRNPRYFLSLLSSIAEQTDIKLMVHFWGKTGGLETILNESPVATYHGTVENQYVRYILDHSDFVLNIGNAIAYNMLPSKIFGIFATGKPIINMITHPKDATRPYFERYNHSIDINEYSMSKDDANTLAAGILKMKNLPLRDVTGLFDDFKPETICDFILM